MKRTIILMLVCLSIVTVVAAQGTDAQTPAVMPTAEQILERYVVALGGNDSIQKVTSRISKGTFTSADIGGSGSVEIYAKAPNRQVTIMLPSGIGAYRVGFNGSVGWMQGPGSAEFTELPGFPKRDVDFYQATKLKELYPRIAFKGSEKIGSRESYVLEAPRGGNPKRWYLDTESHLLIRTEVRDPRGHVLNSESYDDYRTVDGIKVPFDIRRLDEEGFDVTIKLSEVKHNVQIDDAKFDKPVDHGGSGPSETPKNSVTEASPGLRQKTFEVVWRTVKETHFDPNFGGVDWNKVRDQYAPQVAAANNDRDFYKLLNKMLSELRLSHFEVISPQALKQTDSKLSGYTGIDVQIIDELAVISRVERGSAAERAGLRTGFILKRIGDFTIEELVRRIAERAESSALKRAELAEAVCSVFYGEVGTTLRIGYLDGQNQPHEALVGREKIRGELVKEFGTSFEVDFEARRLAGEIGYIRFNVFHSSLNAKIRAAILSMKDAPGIIIDLRGNGGGDDSVGVGLAGLLFTRPTLLYRTKTRTQLLEYTAQPQENSYLGPVVILLDGKSASASEQFSAAMQESGRAVVVGERSPGADLDADGKRLPTGAVLMFAYGEPRTPKGLVIEGRGVIPDIEVKLTRDGLSKGGDPQLDRAISYIQSKKK